MKILCLKCATVVLHVCQLVNVVVVNFVVVVVNVVVVPKFKKS